jgi:DNA-binding MarR family transcriptional regulator
MNDPASPQLSQLIWQTRRIFQRLRSTSDEMLADSGINAGQRALLEFLYRQQQQTVPQIAREKSVSRQHIQAVVNELLQLGLITNEENPTHKRSPLIHLTNKGKKIFSATQKTELAILAKLEKKFSPKDLAISIITLATLDDYLSAGEWRQSRKP